MSFASTKRSTQELKGPFGWRSEMMENCEDGKYLVFSFVCLVGGVEKWKDEKLFCLVGEKKGKDGKCNLYKLTIIPLLHNM